MEILGVDVGGSGIKAAPVNIETGEMTAQRFRLPTPEGATPAQVAEVVRQQVDHFAWSGPIGCGFPAVVHQGVLFSAANIAKEWIGVNGENLLSNITGCPVYLVNDADAAGMAEMRFGAGRNLSKGVVVMLTLGTGIGSAVFVDGKLLPNTEFGHLEIRGKDAERRAADAARQRKNLSWQAWSERLQEYLSTLEKLIWPDVIIIGGGVSKEADKFLPYLKIRARIIPAQLLNQAGIVGAAVYAQSKM